jgi:hypothetical protein
MNPTPASLYSHHYWVVIICMEQPKIIFINKYYCVYCTVDETDVLSSFPRDYSTIVPCACIISHELIEFQARCLLLGFINVAVAEL